MWLFRSSDGDADPMADDEEAQRLLESLVEDGGADGDYDDESGGLSKLCSCSLTWSQRLWGFGVFFTIGCVLNILSSFFVSTVLLFPAKFAVPYTLGNICSICSTAFLMGPVEQCRSMFSRKRVVSTVVYFGAMLGTLVTAFSGGRASAVFAFIIIQTIAFVFYCLSYIPMAQSLAWGAIVSLCESIFSL